MLPRRAQGLLAIVPGLALLGARWLANRDEPRVLGMPMLLVSAATQRSTGRVPAGLPFAPAMNRSTPAA